MPVELIATPTLIASLNFPGYITVSTKAKTIPDRIRTYISFLANL